MPINYGHETLDLSWINKDRQEVIQKKEICLSPATQCRRRQVSGEPEKAWPAETENGTEMTVTDHISKKHTRDGKHALHD